jgi:5-methylcytosine-specific restriction endonuclease McrA
MAIDLVKKRARQLRWKHQRRDDAIVLLGGKCIDCGSTENLEFDHVDPALKRFNPTDIWSRNVVTRIDELAKCVLRCNSCHKKKTLSDSK